MLVLRLVVQFFLDDVDPEDGPEGDQQQKNGVEVGDVSQFPQCM